MPVAVIAAQFPIFMLAETVGDAFGRSTVADGLGMAVTGAAWGLLAYALTRQPYERPETTPATRRGAGSLIDAPTETLE